MHLLGNMLGLYFFGREVGRAFGGRALLALYLAGGLVGSLAHVAWKWSQIRGKPQSEKPVKVTSRFRVTARGRVVRGVSHRLESGVGDEFTAMGQRLDAA